ncbi:MAG: hypothetical protein KDA80_02990 [Planctomycetaceae bacterium]|nr:hypothetical protein [Planctomycetaceae bacterium]
MSVPSSSNSLEEPLFLTNTARMRRWLPWIRILDGFRIAIQFRCLLLGFVAVLAWAGGMRFLSDWGELDDPFLSRAPHVAWPWEETALPPVPAIAERVEFQSALTTPGRFLVRMCQNGPALLWPLQRIALTGIQLFDRSLSSGDWLRAAFQFLWLVAVAGLFGGAICRIAALDFAGSEVGSMRSALGFSIRHWFAYLGAPIAALLGLLALWVTLFFAGLVGWIPVVGELMLGFTWILVWLAGLAMAILLSGLTAGFPLMIAAISSESSDSFDGLSRAYSYLFHRPWYALFLSCLSILYGSALLYFFMGMLTLAVDLGTAAVSVGYGNQTGTRAYLDAPVRQPFLDWQVTAEELGDPRDFSPWGRWAIGVWSRVLLTLPAAFVFSFFWTAVTISYFLLRLREDATPLDEVGGKKESRSRSPLVGMAAAMAREKAAATRPNGETTAPLE